MPSRATRDDVPAGRWGSPTHTGDLVAATLDMVEHGQRGAFHATGPEFVDRLSLARWICDHFGLSTLSTCRVATRRSILSRVTASLPPSTITMAVHGQPLARTKTLVPEILSRPMYLELTDVDAQTVAEHINAWARDAATLT